MVTNQSKRKREALHVATQSANKSSLDNDIDKLAKQGEIEESAARRDGPSTVQSRRQKKRRLSQVLEEPTSEDSLSTTPSSPFFKLPAKLRIQIYEELLPVKSQWRITHNRHQERSGFYIRTKINNKWDISPVLLATNKQIHDEAIGILFSQPFWFADPFSFKRFCNEIGPRNTKRLTNIIISIKEGPYDFNTRLSYTPEPGPGASRAFGSKLIACTGLCRLRLEVALWDRQKVFRLSPVELAAFLGEIVFPHLHTIASKWLREDGSLDVLEITTAKGPGHEGEESLKGPSESPGPYVPFSADEKAQFDGEIKRLMPIHKEARKKKST